MTPEATYNQRCAQIESELAHVARVSSRLSQLRVLAFLLFLVPAISAIDGASAPLLTGTLLALAAFVALVIVHGRVKKQEQRLGGLLQLNRDGLRRLARDWDALPATPALADLRTHDYGDDLDLFGRASISQLLGQPGTVKGRLFLESWLLAPASPAVVRARQQALQELAPAIDWRDELALHARRTASLRPDDLDAFLRWAETRPKTPLPGWSRVAAWLLPLTTWTLLLLDLWLPTTSLWLTSGLVTFVLALSILPRVHRTFRNAFAREAMFAEYPELLSCLRQPDFRAPLLVELKERTSTEGVAAPEALRRLERIMNLADMRYSSLHILVQVLTLSDLHVLQALERWQHRHGATVRQWLEALGETEALCCLAVLAHDQPDWAFPVVDEQTSSIDATALAHPLLPDAQRISNDVSVGPAGTFLFVTGSNMSGKSTLLRSLGMNIVLAQAGAPVCARALRLPPAQLFTAIRVQDSLSRGVSYFMAELERLKSIVDGTARPAAGRVPVYLLDEVLHGTNSVERRIAARHVIRQLIDLGALGAATSHDLDLVRGGELEGAARSVHFREHFREVDAQLYMSFDYILRPGLAPTTNALKLLELVGLAIDEQTDPTVS